MPAQLSDEVRAAQMRFVDRIGDGWALVTAGTMETGWNTMTIGWGSAGVLWSRPIMTVYVHPWRYTHGFMLDNDYFTIQLFGDEYKRDLGILGSKAGRDGDKVALTSLTPRAIEHGVTFEEASDTTRWPCGRMVPSMSLRTSLTLGRDMRLLRESVRGAHR